MKRRHSFQTRLEALEKSLHSLLVRAARIPTLAHDLQRTELEDIRNTLKTLERERDDVRLVLATAPAASSPPCDTGPDWMQTNLGGAGSSDHALDPDGCGWASHQALHHADQSALDAVASAAEVDAFNGARDTECLDDADFT